MGFNLAPSTQAGSGAYGAVPGAIGAPPSIFSQVNSNVPGAAGLATGAAGNIASEQAGMLSPGTQNLLRNNAAAMGVSVGQPGGAPGNTISNENLLTNMGLTSEGLSQQGDQGYLSFLGGVGQTQQNPNLLADIASNNATMAAAPNPAAAAAQQQAQMMQYFNLLRGPTLPAGSTGVHGAGSTNLISGGGGQPTLTNPLGTVTGLGGGAPIAGGGGGGYQDDTAYNSTATGTTPGTQTDDDGNPVDAYGNPILNNAGNFGETDDDTGASGGGQ